MAGSSKVCEHTYLAIKHVQSDGIAWLVQPLQQDPPAHLHAARCACYSYDTYCAAQMSWHGAVVSSTASGTG